MHNLLLITLVFLMIDIAEWNTSVLLHLDYLISTACLTGVAISREGNNATGFVVVLERPNVNFDLYRFLPGSNSRR